MIFFFFCTLKLSYIDELIKFIYACNIIHSSVINGQDLDDTLHSVLCLQLYATNFPQRMYQIKYKQTLADFLIIK